MQEVMFKSDKHDWETPDWLFDRLNQEFKFNLDVCATAENAKCDLYIAPEQDALKHNWYGSCWMNPPYGREIEQWMCHAHRQAMEGNCTVVCLVPARTDTRWWWVYAKEGEVRFLRGRLKFKGAENSAPFPSAIVIFRQGMSGFGEGTTMYWGVRDEGLTGE